MKRTPGPVPAPRGHQASFWLPLALALGVSGAARAAAFLHLSFVSDDFLILDKVWWRSFTQLWWRDYNLFGWYRPWSRDLHFWVLYHLAGLRVGPFHLASLALWFMVLALFAAYVRREAGPAAALIGTTGLAALASWGAPLAWIAGSQELWLCLWSLVYLHLLARRQDHWALLALALALMSKETALALPAIGAAYVGLVRRDRPRDQAVRLALDGVVALAWALWHPTLIHRLLYENYQQADRLSQPLLSVPLSLLSFVNLEAWPRPEGQPWAVLLQGVWRILPLFVLAGLTLTLPRAAPGDAMRGRLLFGAAWVAVGVGELVSRSIGWHSYYALLAALGAWYVLGQLLERVRWVAVAVLAIVIVLEPLRAETPGWDWSSFAFQDRAAIYCGHMRESLLRQLPSLPSHSRLYFAEIPENIGFVTADGPAFRVLYRDSTLRGWFIGQYRPRPTAGVPGRDFFFRFDGVTGLRRMDPGGPTPVDPDSLESWESDQRMLAWVFGRGGDWPRAAGQFVALLRFRPASVEYAGNAAECYRRAGDAGRAAAYAVLAHRLERASPAGGQGGRLPGR